MGSADVGCDVGFDVGTSVEVGAEVGDVVGCIVQVPHSMPQLHGHRLINSATCLLLKP